MLQKKTVGEKKRRVRRTKIEIEKLLFDAATKIIERSGFTGLTVTGIVQEAKVDPPVFYNRYIDIEDFIDKYVRNYDYWLRDSIDISIKEKNPIKQMENILNDLIDSLVRNIPMQKLLAWEMNDSNRITQRTAMSRDLTSKYIIDYFMNALKNCSVRYDYSIALFIGGLYYLIIHRKLGTFNYIDFNKAESINELKKNLSLILRKVFGDYEANSSTESNLNKDKILMIQVAKELIISNVDYDIIKKATLLSDTVLKSLY